MRRERRERADGCKDDQRHGGAGKSKADDERKSGAEPARENEEFHEG